MNPAELAIRNRPVCWLVLAGLLVGGWHAYENMPRFEDPEFTIRTAVVATRYSGATAEEVASEVTETLESAIQELPEVDRITSSSTIGLSTINVEIAYAFSRTRDELQTVWGKLRSRVADAASRLPPGASTPSVNDAFGDVYGFYYLITGEGFTPAELHRYAKSLRVELLAVEDVGKVALLGERREAIFVEVPRDRAAALGASLERVYADLARQNAVAPSGDVRVGDRRLPILPSGAADSVEAVGNVPVTVAGAVVRLRDVATVTRGYVEPARQFIRYDGRPAVALGVANVPGANVSKLGEALDRKLAEAEARRPLGIEVHEFYHQGRVVADAVDGFLLNVAAALAIVLGTLFAFMGPRPAVVIGGTLLLTVAATLATMHAFGVPMHRISLGALIIALGMLVDNAIVVAEGFLVGVRAGRPKLAVARDVVDRTKWPLLGGTVVGILAFAPIGLAPGRTAEYTGDLFWVVLISLSFSWVLAMTVVPLFAYLLFPEGGAASDRGEGALRRRYRVLIGEALARRRLVLSAAVALLAVSVFGFRYVEDGFFPASTTPQLAVDYWLPEGTDIGRTHDDMVALETEIAALPGVEAVQTMVGAGGLRYMLVYGPQQANPAYGQLLLKLTDHRRIDDLVPRIHDLLARRPDAQGKVWRFQLGPGAGSKIEAVFSGPDPAVLRRLADEAKGIMADDGRAAAIKDDWRGPVAVVEPRYAAERSRRLGVSREDVGEALRTTFSGRSVGVYREGDTLIPVIARAPAAERADIAGMGAIQVPNPVSGAATPLAATVDGIRTTWRNGRLKRTDRVWTIKAQCDPLPGELPSALLTRLRPRIEALELPPGYALRWEGEAGDSAEANANLTRALPLGFLAMVLVVVLLFNAWRQPLAVFLVVPLAAVGVVAGLLATGTPLEFMALLGVLSLSGLLVKNAIVLVDQADLEIREGRPRWTALVNAACSRARPVTLGALTTMLGVVPLFGDAFFRSMAVVLVFGLGFATLLTLVIVPALYAVLFGIRQSET